MKKTLLTLAVAMISLFASAQSETTMLDILETGQTLCKYLENDKDKEIVHIEYDIIRTTKSMTRVLTSDYTYSIVVFGDRRVKDIDVSLYKWSEESNSWILLKKDEDEDDIAIVEVSPKTNGEYKVEIKVYSFNDGYEAAHYGLIICHE